MRQYAESYVYDAVGNFREMVHAATNAQGVFSVPAIAAGYRRVVKRNGSAALRHLPPALFAGAMVLLLTAAARPTALLVMPEEARTVILAIDVSGSMSADDVAPNRLAAAQSAARGFVKALPASVRIGIVAFSDEAQLVQAPAADREDVLFAIDSLRPQNGTAIGSGFGCHAQVRSTFFFP